MFATCFYWLEQAVLVREMPHLGEGALIELNLWVTGGAKHRPPPWTGASGRGWRGVCTLWGRGSGGRGAPEGVRGLPKGRVLQRDLPEGGLESAQGRVQSHPSGRGCWLARSLRRVQRA
jgi:hypothetical protein